MQSTVISTFAAACVVWDLKNRTILRSVSIPGTVGTIDVKLIPHDHKGRAFTPGMLDDKLYLVDTQVGTARVGFDFAGIAPGGWPQLMNVTRDSTQLFISMNQAGKVAMLDISNPEQPKLIKTLELGEGSGPRYIALTKDEKRLVISDYFLNEDNFGKVHAEGDHKIHVANVSKNEPRARFEVRA